MGCGAAKVAVAEVDYPKRDQGKDQTHTDGRPTQVGHVVDNGSGKKSHAAPKADNLEKGNCENLSDSLSNDGEVPALNRIHTEAMDKSMVAAKADISPNVPKAIAFDVQLQEQTVVSKPLPPLSSYKPPRRLEALHNAPRLTAGQLQQKLAAAESKRNLELQKKKKRLKVTNRTENNRLRDMDQSQEKAKQFEERLRTHNEKRQKFNSERINKQKKQREHEQSVRERAKNIKDGIGTDVSPENELETYQSSDDEQEWGDVADSKNESFDNASESKLKPKEDKEPPKENSDTSIDDFYGA